MTEVRWYDAGPTAPALVFGHGAGAGHDHPWIRRVASGLASRGVTVVTFDFPYKAAGRSVPDKADVLERAFADVWSTAGARAAGPMFAGGKSMGGRIASQSAANGLLNPAPRGLVFFGYPLHPPGRPAQTRDRHLPSVGAPMLFLHGTRDPFGAPEEMSTLVDRLGGPHRLEIVEGGDHSLVASRKAGAGAASLDRAMDAAAAWISAARIP